MLFEHEPRSVATSSGEARPCLIGRNLTSPELLVRFNSPARTSLSYCLPRAWSNQTVRSAPNRHMNAVCLDILRSSGLKRPMCVRVKMQYCALPSHRDWLYEDQMAITLLFGSPKPAKSVSRDTIWPALMDAMGWKVLRSGMALNDVRRMR